MKTNTAKKHLDFATSGTRIKKLEKGGIVFGQVKEIVSRRHRITNVGLAIVTLWGPDIMHYHENTREIYICKEGEGEIYFEQNIYNFNPGKIVIIDPGTLHAARPKRGFDELIFECISTPSFDPHDFFEPKPPDGRNW